MAPSKPPAEADYTTFQRSSGFVEDVRKAPKPSLKAKVVAIGILLLALGAFVGLRGNSLKVQSPSESEASIANLAATYSGIERGATVYTGCDYTYSTEEDRDAQCGSGGTSRWIDDSNLINTLARSATVYTGCGYTYSSESQRDEQCGSGGTSMWIDDRCTGTTFRTRAGFACASWTDATQADCEDGSAWTAGTASTDSSCIACTGTTFSTGGAACASWTDATQADCEDGSAWTAGTASTDSSCIGFYAAILTGAGDAGYCRSSTSSDKGQEGVDYTRPQTSNIDGCKAICDADSSCQGIEYQTKGTCEVWTTLPQYTSGESSKAQCLLKPTTNDSGVGARLSETGKVFDGLGHDTDEEEKSYDFSDANTLALCEAFCEGLDRCTTFSFGTYGCRVPVEGKMVATGSGTNDVYTYTRRARKTGPGKVFDGLGHDTDEEEKSYDFSDANTLALCEAFCEGLDRCTTFSFGTYGCRVPVEGNTVATGSGTNNVYTYSRQ